MLWVVTLNTSNCRIYHYQKHLNKLTLIKELNHPESRLKNRDITSDRPGHYHKSLKTSRGAYEPASDPKANEVDIFSRDIAKVLNCAKKDNLYRELILITAPHMHGVLNQHLNKNVQTNITETIHKDLQTLSEKALSDYLAEYLP